MQRGKKLHLKVAQVSRTTVIFRQSPPPEYVVTHRSPRRLTYPQLGPVQNPKVSIAPRHIAESIMKFDFMKTFARIPSEMETKKKTKKNKQM
jgi:hypothetical protein